MLLMPWRLSASTPASRRWSTWLTRSMSMDWSTIQTSVREGSKWINEWKLTELFFENHSLLVPLSLHPLKNLWRIPFETSPQIVLRKYREENREVLNQALFKVLLILSFIRNVGPFRWFVELIRIPKTSELRSTRSRRSSSPRRTSSWWWEIFQSL